MSKPRVAVLGLGIMGGGMATRLLSAGFPLSVYNRSREKSAVLAKGGAFVAASPREAVARAEIVISMVADDIASRTVWLGNEGALAGAPVGSLLLESSTLSVELGKGTRGLGNREEMRISRCSRNRDKAARGSGRVIFHGGRLARGIRPRPRSFVGPGKGSGAPRSEWQWRALKANQQLRVRSASSLFRRGHGIGPSKWP